MGNVHGKRSEIMFDGGYFVPQDIYPASEQDFEFKLVEKLIRERRLCPFYMGAGDPDDQDTTPSPEYPDHIKSAELTEKLEKFKLSEAASEKSPNTASSRAASPSTFLSAKIEPHATGPTKNSTILADAHEPLSSQLLIDINRPAIQSNTSSGKYRFPDSTKTPTTPNSMAKQNSDFGYASYANLLKRVIECPICFLYYPQNINYTVCCSKPICTECFCQFKRTEKHITPVECPYCLATEFKIIYSPQSLHPSLHKKKIRERYGKSVSHSISSSSMLNNPGHHKRSFSDAPFSVISNAVSSDDIRPKMLQKIEREKARKADRINQREMIIASVARIADQYAIHNTAISGTGGLLRANSEGRELLREFRSRGGASLEEFLVQEAIALSQQEMNTRSLSSLVDAHNNSHQATVSSPLRSESDNVPSVEALPQ